MKNVLFISSYPFPLNKGSNQHAYFFIKALSLHYNVYCVFFVQPENINGDYGKLYSYDLPVKRFDICDFNDNSGKGIFYYRMQNIFAFPYEYMNLATHRRGMKLINSYINNYSIDIIHFEHLHYVKYLFNIPRNMKTVFVYHDLYHLIPWKQIKLEKGFVKKLLLLNRCLKIYAFQRKIDFRVNKKVFLSLAEMLLSPKKSVYVPHVVNPDIVYSYPKKNELLRILFIGGFNHPPNRMSVKFIIEKILPPLLKKTNRFQIQIVGSGSENFERYITNSYYRRFFHIRGFVKDINDVFKTADIGLFPILYGGGIKTKIIETMAAGLPVVTTPEGVFGLNKLPANCVGVAKSSDDLIREIILLMNNFETRIERSQAAKAFVEKEHSFNAMSNAVSRIYQNL